MQKTVTTIIVLLIIVVAGWLIFRSGPSGPGQTSTTTPTSTAQMMEGNTVTANAQAAMGTSTISISEITLTDGGFVVVHEDDEGSIGDIIGSSDYLGEGEHSDVSVTLNRDAEAGETLYAMLHSDDGDQEFTAASDTPIMGDNDSPITSSFLIGAEDSDATTTDSTSQ